MSLLWNSALRLRVEPRSVSAAMRTGWPAQRRFAAMAGSMARLAPATPLAGATPIDPDLLESVLLELAVEAPLRGARMHVEVADELVHFDVVEGDFAAQSDRQLQSIAVACVAELLGDAAAGHDVRWSLQAGERHLLIAALPRSLVDLLEAAAARHGVVLKSVQPAFATSWNAFMRGRDDAPAVFASTSGWHALVSCVVDGAVRAVSSGPWQDSGSAAANDAKATGFAASADRGAARLDERAARLIASAGIAGARDAGFLVVGADPSAVATSPGWTAVAAPELAP
ncbi:MAG: hypothetical protein ABI520_11695 [Caldimonas sp.]